ncbi:hypothetical protein [Streptomyces sp. JJ36]|uniref:hypothetical protein n=1 Tax=Streptomyces sp. JJ36 TaxID=2736645 RepID=UPI001F2E5A38|nr:hypothetical protein [Streptomyces sp. JJ36]MCF6522097.1 hypothetical protein [Streptomyces sp. JJ36]
MARIRTARVLAAVAAVPVAVALMGGVAQADTGTNGIVNTQVAGGSSGVGNQANNAGVNNSGFTHIDQDNVAVNFAAFDF